MKILHTADWHLGKHLGVISRHQEQIAVLDEICGIADSENVDVVLVAGDLFDTFNPPAESVELMYRSLKRLAKNGERAVVAIAGNHDSPERIEAPDPLARECGIIFAGYPNAKITPFSLIGGISVIRSENGFIELRVPGAQVPLRILLTPYANEARLKSYFGAERPEVEMRTLLQTTWSTIASKYCDDLGINILVAHLFLAPKDGKLPEESDDEKPIIGVGGAQVVYPENIPKEIQFAALGHLHRHHEVALKPTLVAYSGSPLAFSMSEADQDKYVIVVDAKPAKPVVSHTVQLKKGKRLIRKQFTGVGQAVTWLEKNANVLVEVTMKTETFMTAQDRKQLFDAHDGIVDVIPIVRAEDGEVANAASAIDLRLSVEQLFGEYFRSQHGQAPNSDLINLLREVLAEGDI